MAILHTAGPWHWTNFGGSEMLVTKHSGSMVVLCAGKNKHHAPEICARIRITSRLVSLKADHPDAQLIASAPAMDLIIRLIAAGKARFENTAGLEFCFDGIRYSVGDGDWSALLDIVGWNKVRAALE